MAFAEDIETWEEGAHDAAELILNEWRVRAYAWIPDEALLDKLRACIDVLADDTSGAWSSDTAQFVTLGTWAMSGAYVHACATNVSGLLHDIAELAAAKHHDYGQANIERFGVEGILVRMSDKVERLKNLATREDSPAIAESVLDAWTDLVGYSIVGIMFINGTFTLPLAADVTSSELSPEPQYGHEPCSPNCQPCAAAKAKAARLLSHGNIQDYSATDAIFYNVLGQDQAKQFLADIDALDNALADEDEIISYRGREDEIYGEEIVEAWDNPDIFDPELDIPFPIYIREDGVAFQHNGTRWREMLRISGMYTAESTLADYLL